MKSKLLPLCLAISAMTLLPSAASAMAAQEAMSLMNKNQYVAVYDLQKKYGYWTAKAVTSDGVPARLLVSDTDSSFTAVHNNDMRSNLPGAEQVAQHLRSLGYRFVYDLEMEDGFWQAKARQSLPHGEKIELILHPQTLAVLSQVGKYGGSINNQPVLGIDQIKSSLQLSGYSSLRDIEFDDGYWEAEAINTANQRVELRVNAVTGKVVREQLDD